MLGRSPLPINGTLLLEPPKEKMLFTFSARFFYAAAPSLWKSLAAELHAIPSLTIFKRNLKTYLFGFSLTILD